jgi:hypothetical protein
MKTKRLLFLACCTLATNCVLGLSPVRAETPVPMPTDVKFDPAPEKEDSPTSKVMVYENWVDPSDKSKRVIVPAKYLRITNNSDRTMYPIMRAQNNNVLTFDPGRGLYDPLDTPKREYRGYIGYKGADGKFYYGLPKGKTIKVRIPLVFWDAGRMGIETGGEYLTHNQDKAPNPLRNDKNAIRSITASEKQGNQDSDIKPAAWQNDGVIMWYRSDATDTLAVAPADDSQDQLVEWTIRDHNFFVNPIITARTTGPNQKCEIPDNQLVTLINYDVSNVDSLYLPVSMEALDSWVTPQGTGTGPNPNRTGWKPGANPEPLGWTGSIENEKFLQDAIIEFIGPGKKGKLGNYFGGKGWPYYNFPGFKPDGSSGIMAKIPSGANLFPQSPLLDVRSSYADGVTWTQNQYMLSSGGTEPVFVNIGSAGEQLWPSKKNVIVLAPETDAAKLKFLKKDYHVVGRVANQTNPIDPESTTTIKEIKVVGDGPAKRTQIVLSKDMVASPQGATFDFFRPPHDYAAEDLITLWFSWADYFMKNTKVTAQKAKAQIEPQTATLTLTDKTTDQLGLTEGMAVKGPGLLDCQTEVGEQTGPVIILKINGDKKSMILSQLATAKGGAATEYEFLPPQPLYWGNPSRYVGKKLYTEAGNFNFDLSRVEECRNPNEFAKEVFLIMASMDQIGRKNNNTACKFMQDIIGANMGFIFTKDNQTKDDAQMVMAIIRDKIKSVLRGVSDFTKYPDTNQWYPVPGDKAPGYVGKLDFNVFNLDPYVWFVHRVLGFSGYGFSVDDDTADVGADGATVLQVSITGTNGLKNTNQWAAQAPFGPVTFSCEYSGPPDNSKEFKENTQYFTVFDASNTTPIKIFFDPKLHSPVKEGDQVVVESVEGNQAANGTFTVQNVGRSSFELKDSAGSGPYKPKTGRWGLLPYRAALTTGKDLTQVFDRVKGDAAEGTYLGTWVSVNGVDRNPIPDPKTGQKERFRVWQRGMRDNGQLLLNIPLTDASGNPLPKGTYTVKFFGDVNQ